MEKIIITFSAGTIFGKGDSVDWDLDYEVTQEEYNRLKSAFKRYYVFDESEDVSDIYENVYQAAVDKATSDLLEYDYEMVEDYIDEDDPESWRADDVFEIRVNYPYEWDEEDNEEEE